MSSVLKDSSFSRGEEDGVVAARRVGAQGRSKVSIDGSLASVKELATRIGIHVDLCGRFEHQHLLSSAYQRQLLDVWAGERVLPFFGGISIMLFRGKGCTGGTERLREVRIC